MFNSCYLYKNVGKSKMYPKGHLFRHTYKFKTDKNRKYIVWVDEHEFNTFIIKFFLQKDENSKNKFNILIGDNTAARVICTNVNIMFDILQKNKTASFAFTGAETPEEEANNISITKRFKIYELLMKSKFGIENFSHVSAPEQSAYLMYNLKNDMITVNQIIEMITNNYPEING